MLISFTLVYICTYRKEVSQTTQMEALIIYREGRHYLTSVYTSQLHVFCLFSSLFCIIQLTNLCFFIIRFQCMYNPTDRPSYLETLSALDDVTLFQLHDRKSKVLCQPNSSLSATHPLCMLSKWHPAQSSQFFKMADDFQC